MVSCKLLESGCLKKRIKLTRTRVSSGIWPDMSKESKRRWRRKGLRAGGTSTRPRVNQSQSREEVEARS